MDITADFHFLLFERLPSSADQQLSAARLIGHEA